MQAPRSWTWSMRSAASAGALLNTSISTVTTNSMVVKSSLWRRTRHSLGRLVRVFFSVTTAVSPPSRGFRLAICAADRTAARGLLNLRPASGRPAGRPIQEYRRARLRRAGLPLCRLLQGARHVVRREDEGGAGPDREGRRAQVPPEECRAGKTLCRRARPPPPGRRKL